VIIVFSIVGSKKKASDFSLCCLVYIAFRSIHSLSQ
jgi:hypothetical protein